MVGACWPELVCQAENGKYLLTLGELGENGQVVVRTLTIPDADPRMVAILGDFWDSRTITEEFQDVIKVFQEFHSTGTVGNSLNSLSE